MSKKEIITVTMNEFNNHNLYKIAYGDYWDLVKDLIDEEGWVYSKDAPYMLDYYFEKNTGKQIEYQKSFGKSGENPHWLIKGSRWRPTAISNN